MNDELYHHGIKGQKWGVRRYQNDDGSLTSAGKRRYAAPSDKETQEKRDLLVVRQNATARNSAKYNNDAKNSLRKGRLYSAYWDHNLSRAVEKQSRKADRKIARLDDRAEAEARKAIKVQRKHDAKNVSLMSDDEINARINRLQKERLLKDLTKEVVTPGRYKATQMLDRYGGQMLSMAAGGVVTGVGMRVVSSMMDVKLAKEGFKVKGYNPDGTPNYGGNSGEG